MKSASFDQGKEGPAEVGFGTSGEDEGDDQTLGRGPNFGKEAGEAGSESSGIDDEVTSFPLVAQGSENRIEIGMGNALPAEASDDAVEGKRWRCGRGGDNIDDGESGEIVGDLRLALTPATAGCLPLSRKCGRGAALH